MRMTKIKISLTFFGTLTRKDSSTIRKYDGLLRDMSTTTVVDKFGQRIFTIDGDVLALLHMQHPGLSNFIKRFSVE